VLEPSRQGAGFVVAATKTHDPTGGVVSDVEKAYTCW
jgi:hypothetical protein